MTNDNLEGTALEIARVAYRGIRKDTPEWQRCMEAAKAIHTGEEPIFVGLHNAASLAFDKAAEFNRNFPIGTDGTINGQPTRVEKEALVFPHARNGEDVMAWFAFLGWKQIDGFKKAEQSITLAQELVSIAKQAQNQGKVELAEHLYKAAINADPSYWHTYNELGALYNFTERHHQAILQYTKALEYAPNSGEVLSNRGMCYRAIGEPELALADCKEALRWLPGHSLITLNMAGVLDDLNMVDECLEIVRDHVRLNPENPNIQYNLALLLLSDMRFAEGWRQYDWRLRQPTATAHYEHYNIPRWNGETLTNKRVLVWAEQGVGDEIITASMLPDLLNMGAHVTLLASSRLMPLFERSFPYIRVLQRPDNTRPEAYRRELLPRYLVNAEISDGEFDYQMSQVDLGMAFRTKLADFQRRDFLTADHRRRAEYRAGVRLAAPDAKLIVGISWNSHRNIRIGKLKGMSLEQMLPLLKTPGVAFVNLQYGDTTAEREKIFNDHGIKILDLGVDPLQSMDDFAALVDAMDCVVTVSNTAAHIAGGLGVKTFLLTPEGPGRLWYHFRSIDYSPWYINVELIRQTGSSLWALAIDRAAFKVASLVSE